MSQAKKTGQRSASKKKAVAPKEAKHKKEKSQRVRIILSILYSNLKIQIVRVCWTQQSFIDPTWTSTHLWSDHWCLIPIQNKQGQVHLLLEDRWSKLAHQEPEGNWWWQWLCHPHSLCKKIRRFAHCLKSGRHHQSSQSHHQTPQPPETVQCQFVVQQLMGPFLKRQENPCLRCWCWRICPRKYSILFLRKASHFWKIRGSPLIKLEKMVNPILQLIQCD